MEKQQILQRFLRTPGIKPISKLEKDLRSQVHGYRLDSDPGNNTLWRLRDSGHHKDRRVVLEDMTFDVITRVHCQHAHPGKNKTFDLVRQDFYGITKEEVAWIVKHCRICLNNQPAISRQPLEPIISNNVFEHIQIDLIDMRLEKDSIYQWILHIKDHFSKYR